MYVMEQPKHASLSIVWFSELNMKVPLEDVLHKGLDKLHDFSDLVFIYSPKFTKKIDKEKFAALYQATSWIEVGDSETETLIKTLDYIREIFYCHVQINFLFASDFSVHDLDCISKLHDNRVLSLNSSVLNIERHDSGEMFRMYYDNDSDLGMYRIYYTPSHILRLGLETCDLIRTLSKTYYKTFDTYIRDFIPCSIKRLGIDYINKNIWDL